MIGAIFRQRSICSTVKFDTPMWRTLPARRSSAIAVQPSSMSASSTGQWIWYRSIASTCNRRRLSSTSRRISSRVRRIPCLSSHTMPLLVKIRGLTGDCFTASPTIVSEWPSP